MTKEKIFVGFAFTGGIGSHPGILTSSEIEKMGNDNFGFENFGFFDNSRSKKGNFTF